MKRESSGKHGLYRRNCGKGSKRLTEPSSSGKFDQPVSRCSLCGSDKIARYHRDSDGITIDRCGGCHVQFMNQQYTDEYLRDYYSRYTVDEPKWNEPLLYCHGFYLSLVEKFLSHPCRLFDVGSGKGHLRQAAALRGWVPVGYEIDPKTAVGIGKKIGAEVLHGDFSSLPLPPGSFDAVTIHHVLEHLKDPVPYIRKVHSLLKTGGILFLALPNIRGLASTVKFYL